MTRAPAWSRNAAESLVALLPHAESQALQGQFHTLTPEALTPVLEKFFLDEEDMKQEKENDRETSNYSPNAGR